MFDCFELRDLFIYANAWLISLGDLKVSNPNFGGSYFYFYSTDFSSIFFDESNLESDFTFDLDLAKADKPSESTLLFTETSNGFYSSFLFWSTTPGPFLFFLGTTIGLTCFCSFFSTSLKKSELESSCASFTSEGI